MKTIFHRWGLFVPALLLAAAALAQESPAPAGDRPVKNVPALPLPDLPSDFEKLPDAPAGGGTVTESGRKVPAQIVSQPTNLPPLGLPSDGEAVPEFPDLPPLPDSTSAQIPTDPSAAEDALLPGDPADPSAPPAVLPRPPAGGSGPITAIEWHSSPIEARRLAREQNRCMLLVFSVREGLAGSTVKQLNSSIFLTPEFNELANRHLVLSFLDYTAGGAIRNADEVRRDDALKAAKTALKVRGYPTVILFAPDGREIARWAGFLSSKKRSYFDRLRQTVEGHGHVTNESAERRTRLAAQGYRDWTSAAGSTLFGKLVEFDAHMAVFRDENGADRKVDLRKLSIIDRELITRQRLGLPTPAKTPPAPPEAAEETTVTELK